MNPQQLSINNYGGVEITTADGSRIPTSRDIALSRGITRYETAEQLEKETGGMIFHYNSSADEIPELIYRFPFSVELLSRYDRSGENFVISQLVTTPNLYHLCWFHPPTDSSQPMGVLRHVSTRSGEEAIEDEVYLPPNNEIELVYPPSLPKPKMPGKLLSIGIGELDRIKADGKLMNTFMPYIARAIDWRQTSDKPCFFFNVTGTEIPYLYWFALEGGRKISLNWEELEGSSWTLADGEPIVLMQDFYTPLPSTTRGSGFGAGIKKRDRMHKNN
jgi:hypothetical protein